MHSTTKSKVAWCSIAILIGSAIWLWRYLESPKVDRTASRMAEAMRRGDWGDVYDLASNKEKKMQPFGRKQFVELMSLIAKRRFGNVQSVTFSGDWQRQTTSKFFTFSVRTDQGAVVPIYLHLYRDYDDWHPEVVRLPLLIYSSTNPATREDVQFLYNACVQAGVRSIVRPSDRLEFSVERLGRYLSGETKWSSVSRPLPDL